MSNEIDPKVRAQVLRDLVETAESESNDAVSVEYLRRWADTYDPPRPKIEPGTLCEADTGDGRTVCGYIGANRLYDNNQLEGESFDVDLLANIRPVQQLKPTQVAVSVPRPKHWPRAAEYVELLISYRTSPGHDDNIARSISIEQARRMWADQ